MVIIKFLAVQIYGMITMFSGIMATLGFLPLAISHPPWWAYALFVLNLFVFMICVHFQVKIYRWSLEE